MEWVLSHMEDPDFNDPLPASSSSQAPAPAQPQSSQKPADPEQVSILEAMGFTPQQVLCYLVLACDSLTAQGGKYSHSCT